MKKGLIAIMLTIGSLIPAISSAELSQVSVDEWDSSSSNFWLTRQCDETVNNEMYVGSRGLYVDTFKNKSNGDLYILETKVFTTGSHLKYNNSKHCFSDGSCDIGLTILNTNLKGSDNRIKVSKGKTVLHMTTAEKISGANFIYDKSTWKFTTPFTSSLGDVFNYANYASDGTHPTIPTKLPKWDTEFRTITLYSHDHKISTSNDNYAIVECQRTLIRWCGDGILDTENGETCDPKAQPWIDNHACDPVTCKGKTPVCKSSYNGQTVSTLVSGNYLCEIGTMTDFHYNETTNTWTWKCDNVAGNSVNCSATKASNGVPKIEKILKDKKTVTQTGQLLTWEIRIWAEGGDVTDFKVKDILPFTLEYKPPFKVLTNTDNLEVLGPTGPQRISTGNVYTWQVNGTLHQGNELVLQVTTRVVKMEDDANKYKNVACVVKNGTENCDDDEPQGEPIIKKTLIGNKTVEKVGDILKWKIEVTASGGDISGFKLQDKVPVALAYKKIDVVENVDGLNLGNPTGPVLDSDGKHNVYTWNVKGTLKKGHKLVLEVTTEVVSMPTSEDDYKNVACVIKDGIENCDDDKPQGRPIIKKTLIGNKTVEKVGDILKWKIEVTASGGNVSGFTLQDKVPVALAYKKIDVVENVDGLNLGNPTGPVLDSDGKHNVYTWNVKGTLKKGHKLVLEVTTEVVSMPTSEDDYKNVACVIKDEIEDCDDDKPKDGKLRIKKFILDENNKEVKSIELKENDTITYIIRFGNSGSVDATITSIKDFLPKNVQYKSGSIHIDRASTHGDGTQAGDMDLVKGFKVVDGVRIEIYGGMTLKPGDEGYIIITGEIKSDYQDNTTNFACIYLDDTLVDCDNAWHSIKKDNPDNPPHNPDGPKTPLCKSMDINDSTVTCKTNGISAWFRLKCGENNIIGHSTSRDTEREFTGVNCPETIICEVLDSKNGTTLDTCQKKGGYTGPQECFNVNAGNFSIHEGEIFPFYWNLFNMENWIKDNRDNYVQVTSDYRKAPENYENKYDDADCTDGNIAQDSMVCTFKIYYGGGNKNPLYKIEGPCLTNKKPLENNNLLKAWYNAMKAKYCNDSKSCYFSYNDARDGSKSLLPSAVYYIKNFGSGAELSLDGSSWEGNRGLSYNKDTEKNAPYGEYQIRLEDVKYLKCVGGKWEQKSAADDADFKPCESNFVLTNSYTVQKTPSGNLTASTEKLSKYKYLSGDGVFSDLISAIKTTDYASNNDVEKAMESFINKYSKLAVTVDLGDSSFLQGREVKKVPGKNIYFVAGDLTVKGGKEIKTPFTIVQTDQTKTVTIVGNVQHNMMLLTKGNIRFEGSCTGDQTVKGIFYAKGNLNRGETTKKRNDNINQNVWCTNGGLHIKGVLIGNNFDNLMNNSRSHLNDWFNENNKKKSVMNGASVLIEYSPSIFSKSTMPPGAEDFTTALSIYKQ